MVRNLVLAALALCTTAPAILGESSADHQLNEIIAWGRRPLRDIGVTKTVLDSAMLRDNISMSMADVLAFNSSIYIKSYGRATLSTVTFRGTSPAHTRISWNGLELNSPMLGSTDLSLIPAFFIDRAEMLHGASGVGENGGSPGGQISLSNMAADIDSGLGVRYVQGIGSFSTFDEYGRISYGGRRWKFSTRGAYSSSPNDFKFVNRDKKVNVYDDDHNIISQYHPTERNRNGAYRDLNLMQEAYYISPAADEYSLKVWYTASNRELPMLSTDYADESEYENRQREQTIRVAAGWNRSTERLRLRGRTGYVHTWLAYDYRRDGGSGTFSTLTRSRSKVNTFFGRFDADWDLTRRLQLSGNISLTHSGVKTADLSGAFPGGPGPVGYDRGRAEVSAGVQAKWQATDALGISAVLRQETAGSHAAAPVPALFADILLSRRGNVTLRAGGSRIYKAPTLNDLYFLPGGNPDLRDESGWTYECGLSTQTGIAGRLAAAASVTWFDSYIDDWILWLPTPKGFFAPRNIRRVHAYGIEARGNLAADLGRGWFGELSCSYSWTPSINRGDRVSDADRSVGRQLPYTPRHSASLNATASWHSWNIGYKWCYYSPRYTQSSNEVTISGRLKAYFMSNLSLGRDFRLPAGLLSVKLAVNNLFDADYVTVLSRPMPGINYELFISYTL